MDILGDAADVAAVFAGYDANRDGQLSREELEDFPFPELDADGDGVVTRAEFNEKAKSWKIVIHDD